MPDIELLKARVGALETGLGEVKAKLDKVDDRLRGVEGDLREIKVTMAGLDKRLDTMNTTMLAITGKLPGWWQMIGLIVTLFGLMVGAAKLNLFHS